MKKAPIAFILVALAACTRAGQGSTCPGTLVVALRQEPIVLNPLILEGPSVYTVGELFDSYLTNYDANGNVAADLATYTVAPDSIGSPTICGTV